MRDGGSSRSHAFNNYGMLLYDQGMLDEAEKMLRNALEIDPEYIHAHNNLGIVLMVRGEKLLEKADDHFRIATNIDPEYLDAWNNRGLLHQKLGKSKKAEECFCKALGIENEDKVIGEKIK